jgi:transglutaminase-like putative cysteine protease
MRFTRPSLPHLLLCGFILAASGATSLGLRSRLIAMFLVLLAAAVFAHVSLPRSLTIAATWIARAGTAGAVVMGLIQTLYPVIPEAVIFGVSAVLAHVLVLVAAVLLLARMPPENGVLPATFGALIAAFIQAGPSGLRLSTAIAMVALVAWLAVRDDERGAAVTLRPLPLFVFAAIAMAIAFGITQLLPWAQPQVEVALAKMISNDLEAEAGLSLESRLGDVEKLALSKRVALRVYGDRPEDLRVRTFTSFDGRAWRADPRPPRRLTSADAPAGRWPGLDETPGTVFAEPARDLGAGLRSSRLVVRSPERGAMPAPAHTLAVKVEAVNVDQSPSGILIPTEKAALYAVLFAESGAGEAAPGPEMLEVPKGLDPRLRDLAASIADAGLPEADRVDRVTGYFQSGYRYSLDVGPFRTKDPLAEFVFDKKKGYCEYFATATTLLLRLSGVPARYVTGYAVRSFQRSGAYYVVRDADAHAWAEAYVPGRGWVEVDATPAGDYESRHGGADAGGLFARLQAVYDELQALFAQGGVRGLSLGLARLASEHRVLLTLGLAAALLLRFRERLRRGWREPGRAAAPPLSDPLRPETRSLLASVDARCAGRGAPRPPARAPLEHVRDPAVPLDEGERSACLRAVGAVYAEFYGAEAPAPNQLAGLAAGLAALAPLDRRRRS